MKKLKRKDVYDLGYQDGHMTATEQFNTDERINTIKANGIIELFNSLKFGPNEHSITDQIYTYLNKLKGIK